MREVSRAVDLLKDCEWYHKITLSDGTVTPGHDWEYLWDNIRNAKKDVDYHGKSVLDLGAMEGMWAFEAESSGASYVVTIDMTDRCVDKLLYCRTDLKSSIVPLFNVRVENLVEMLPSVRKPFDIIQHLGLFYHLQDPLGSFSQCRQLIKTNGLLVLETAAERSSSNSCMIFNGVKPNDYHSESSYWWRMYDGGHPQWMPTIPCLKEMLLISGFVPLVETISIVDQPQTKAINSDDPAAVYRRCRVALVARAVEKEEISSATLRKVVRYRG